MMPWFGPFYAEVKCSWLKPWLILQPVLRLVEERITILVGYLYSRKNVFQMKQAHVGMEHSKTSQTRSEQYHNTFIPSLHLADYALCLLVVWIRGLWKAVGRVVLGVYCVLMCMESVLCCGWLQCCSKCFQVPYRSSTAHSFCIQDSLNLPDCVQCWICMVYVGSYVVKFYCC